MNRRPVSDHRPVDIGCHALDLDDGEVPVATPGGSNRSNRSDRLVGAVPDASDDGTDWQCLDARERRRAMAFRFARDRRRYVAAHAALRRILGARLGIAPATVPLVLSPAGKPLLDLPGATCHFSLTRSGSSGWLALAPVPVGIDAERLDTPRDLSTLIATCCTPAEVRALLALGDAQRGPAFLAAWTRKEAALKAWGSGLGEMDPASLEVGLDSAVEVTAPGRPALQLTTVTRGDQVISVAAPRPPGFRLRFEGRPVVRRAD